MEKILTNFLTFKPNSNSEYRRSYAQKTAGVGGELSAWQCVPFLPVLRLSVGMANQQIPWRNTKDRLLVFRVPRYAQREVFPTNVFLGGMMC
jgi:hypothetical protein